MKKILMLITISFLLVSCESTGKFSKVLIKGAKRTYKMIKKIRQDENGNEYVKRGRDFYKSIRTDAKTGRQIFEDFGQGARE